MLKNAMRNARCGGAERAGRPAGRARAPSVRLAGAFTIADVDTVVLALGVRRDEALLGELEGLRREVVHVGDANGVKNGYLGIREGFEAGLAL